MPQTTARGVPYVAGSDVAGAYPETSVNLANYINDRIIDRRGDTAPGKIILAGGADVGTQLTVAAPTYIRSVFAAQAVDASRNLVVIDPNTNKTSVETPLYAGGLSAVSGQTSAGHSWIVRRDGSGEIKTLPDTTFRLIVSAIGQTSTRRVKTKIGAPKACPDVTRLQPRAYQWTDDAFKVSAPGTRLGLIAEEVADIDERLVTRDAEGQVAGLDQHALIAALVFKIDELQARIAALEGAHT